MLERIEAAARALCRPDAKLADLPGLGEWNRACVRSRVETTLGRLNAPAVTSAYQARLAERPSP